MRTTFRLTAATAALALAFTLSACSEKEVDAGYPTTPATPTATSAEPTGVINQPTGTGTNTAEPSETDPSATTTAPETYPILDGKNVNVDEKAADEFSAAEITEGTLWTVETVKKLLVDESRSHEANSRTKEYTVDDFRYVTQYSHPDVANKIGNWALPQWKADNPDGLMYLYQITLTAPKDNFVPREPLFVPVKLIEDVEVSAGPQTSDGLQTLAVKLVTQTRSRFTDSNQDGAPVTGPLKRDVTYYVVRNPDRESEHPWLFADWDGTFEFGNIGIDPNPDKTDE